MLKRIGAMAALSLMLGLVPVVGHADPGPEGCADIAGQSPVAEGDVGDGGVSYGIIGGGSWKVTITRPGLDEPIVISRDHAVPEFLMDAVKPGDHVLCEASEGFVAAGHAV